MKKSSFERVTRHRRLGAGAGVLSALAQKIHRRHTACLQNQLRWAEAAERPDGQARCT